MKINPWRDTEIEYTGRHLFAGMLFALCIGILIGLAVAGG